MELNTKLLYYIIAMLWFLIWFIGGSVFAILKAIKSTKK